MINNQKVIAIIPARGGSKSIPRKNVLDLKGKPLIAWPIELAKSVNRIERIIVSTDDDEIAQVARKYGAEVPFKRPAELAEDETPTLPVLQHCLQYLEKQENYQAHIILLLYATAPYLKKERVEEALDLFASTNCNSVIGLIKDYGRFWKKENQAYKPFYPAQRVNRQYFDPLYREDGVVYFSRRDVLMKMNKIVDEHNIQFLIMHQDENIDIDNLNDFEKAKKC